MQTAGEWPSQSESQEQQNELAVMNVWSIQDRKWKRSNKKRESAKAKSHVCHGLGEWKMIAVTDVWWKIGYYTSWETNSFFYGEIKTLIHLNHQGLWGWPSSFAAQVRRMPGGLPCHPLPPFIMSGVRPLFSRACWVISLTRMWRCRRSTLLFTTHLVLFLTLTRTQFMRTIARPAALQRIPPWWIERQRWGKNIRNGKERSTQGGAVKRRYRAKLDEKFMFLCLAGFQSFKSAEHEFMIRVTVTRGIHGVLLSTASGKETWELWRFWQLVWERMTE